MKTKGLIALLLTALITLSSAPRPAHAQQLLASVVGVVTRGGSGAPGVDVRLRRRDAGAARRDFVARTNSRGEFTFTDLTPSNVVIIAVAGADTATLFKQLNPGRNSAALELDSDLPAARALPEPTGTTSTDAGSGPDASPGPDGGVPAPADASGAAATPATPAPADAAQRQNGPPSVRAPSTTLSDLCQADAPPPTYDLSFARPAASVPTTLNDILNDIQDKYPGVNFAPDPGVPEIKVYSKIRQVPWTAALRLLLEQNDLEARCVNGSIVRIMTRAKAEELSARLRKTAPLRRVDIKLSYIRAATATDTPGPLQSSGNSDNSNSLDAVEAAMNKILKSLGDDRASVTRLPGTNIFSVTGTDEQIEAILDFVRKVDIAPPKVGILTIIYSASDQAVRDVGMEAGVIAQFGNNVFGVNTVPQGTGSGSGSGSGGATTGRVGINPGDISRLPGGQPNGSLRSSIPTGVIGGSTVIGSVAFQTFITLGETKGRFNVQNRNNVTVESGKTVVMKTGQSIPVLTTAASTGTTVPLTSLQYIPATQDVFITPYVIETERRGQDGRLIIEREIALNIRIQNNSINTNLGTFGDSPLPALNQQSLETQLILRDNETAIIGAGSAFNAGQTKNRVPGISSIPLIGKAFERNQENVAKEWIYFGITAVVIDPGTSVSDPADAPADALTSPIPPPPASDPSPYHPAAKTKRKN